MVERRVDDDRAGKSSRLISRSPGGSEYLRDHLSQVGRRAAADAATFGAGTIGQWAGALHDFGKAKRAVQDLLWDRRGRGPDTAHSAEGALRTWQLLSGQGSRIPMASGLASKNELSGWLVAYAIAGHHGGLADGSVLRRILRDAGKTMPADPDWLAGLLTKPEPPFPLRERRSRDDGFVLAFFVRMLFSALVDADRSAAAGLTEQEPGADLGSRLDAYMTAYEARLATLARDTRAASDLAAFRAETMAAARRSAALAPGLFSMSVPTGGGKTMAGLGFALSHARAHGLRRIVYVAPFTAIVEQTTDVIRKAIGDVDVVLEHHSALDLADETDEEASERREAEVRWDAPIVVTTAVQLFESLFAASAGRCRKLHRLARSAVILDEGQALPLGVLRPCLRALSELSRGYGASVLMMTATQPMVRRDDGFHAPEALEGVREIGPPPDVARPAPRARAERAGVMTDEALLERLADVPRCLTILNNRRHARDLFRSAKAEGIDGLFHLSTAMTPVHRRRVLNRVSAALKDRDASPPCRLISTSVVEAGVDLDFPMVLRAMAGIDRIVQAAGRCNREGELGPEGGRLILFDVAEGEGRAAPPELRRAAHEARTVLDRPLQTGANAPLDPLSEDALRRFFANVYRADPDGLDTTEVQIGKRQTRGVMAALKDAHFDDLPLGAIGTAFRLIEDTGAPVVVPHHYGFEIGAPPDLLRDLETLESARGLARRLQPYCVSVPRMSRTRMLAQGMAAPCRAGAFGEAFPVLVPDWITRDPASGAGFPAYDPETGLNWFDDGHLKDEALIA